MVVVQASAKARQRGYRVGFALVAMVVLISLIATPFALSSALVNLVDPPSARVYALTPKDAILAASYNRLHLDITALDESQRVATIRVSGFHLCAQTCNYRDTIIFYSLAGEGDDTQAIPPSASLPLPSNSGEAGGTIQLPISGDLLRYPFDHYALALGAVIERTLPDQEPRILTQAETQGILRLTIREQVARTVVGSFLPLDAGAVKSAHLPFDYAYAGAIDLVRPIYLRIIVVLTILLIAAAALYAMLMRPFDQLIINAGGLILGVWGVRSMLLGSYPADTTAVDIVLTTVIIVLLGGISFRGLNYLHAQAGLTLLPWARPEAAEKEDELGALEEAGGAK